MVRHSAKSEGRPASEDSLPGRPHAATTYRLALASLIFGILPVALALPFLIGRYKPSNLLLFGAIPALAAAWIGLELKDRPDKRITRIATAGAALGMLGILLLVVASGHGIALNDEG
jgi:drug/metabolite transporter (DMT)-like permease